MAKKATTNKTLFKRRPAKNLVLLERDITILKALYVHRFLNTSHLLSLTGTKNRQSLNVRLRQLFDAQYIDRPENQISHWYGVGKGKGHMVYGLGNEGGKYLKENFDWYIPEAGYQTEKNRRVKPLFIEHTLEIADFMIAVESFCLDSQRVRFISFDEIMATAPEGARKRTNLAKWPTMVRFSGTSEKVNIIPDGIFGIHFLDKPEGANKAYFFLEADRGTMPLTRKDFIRQTSFLRKLESYRDTYLNQLQLKYFGIKNFRVLTVTTGEDRANNLLEVCKNNITDVPAGVFLFSHRGELEKANPLTFDWLDSKGKLRNIIKV